MEMNVDNKTKCESQKRRIMAITAAQWKNSKK